MGKNTVLVDVSPILYGSLFSVNSNAVKKGIKPDENTGKIPFDYKQDLVFKIVEEIADITRDLKADKLILAFDNSNGGYWRKDFYDRYKYGRAETRNKSDIDWDKAFEVFSELREVFDNYSRHKVMYVPRTEADDIAFVLSEYWNREKPDETLILHTLDHDWIQNLKFDNVKMFRTRKTQKLQGEWITRSDDELLEMEFDHCVGGDPGDGFLNVKAFSKFSDEFLKDYPKFKGKEKDLYDKHHQIEKMYDEKMAIEYPDIPPNKRPSAYKHPRFMMANLKKKIKSGKYSLEEFLSENEIYRKNFERNSRLCLPTGIPEKYKNQIIKEYKAENKSDISKLQTWLIKNGLFELIGKINYL